MLLKVTLLEIPIALDLQLFVDYRDLVQFFSTDHEMSTRALLQPLLPLNLKLILLSRFKTS